RRTEYVSACGLEEGKTWMRESIELQRQLGEKAGVHEPIPFEVVVDYGEDISHRVSELFAEPLTHAASIVQKAERNVATDEVANNAVTVLGEEFPGREKEIKAAV